LGSRLQAQGTAVAQEIFGYQPNSERSLLLVDQKKTYKEPKSMQGMERRSSVSIPNDPSNEGPARADLLGVVVFANNLGHSRQKKPLSLLLL
jgi:hypothetical protein